MDPRTGVLDVSLDKGPQGTLDYLLMDAQWQVTRGNMGTINVMRRMEDGRVPEL